jgi:hypothetical protein
MDEIRSIITDHAIPTQQSCAQANEDIKSDSGNEGSDSSEKRHKAHSSNDENQSDATILDSLELRSRSATCDPSGSPSPPRGGSAPPADDDSNPEHDYDNPPRPGPLAPPLAPRWTDHEQRARVLLTCPNQGLHEHGAQRYLTQNEGRARGTEHEMTSSEEWSPDTNSSSMHRARRVSAAMHRMQ